MHARPRFLRPTLSVAAASMPRRNRTLQHRHSGFPPVAPPGPVRGATRPHRPCTLPSTAGSTGADPTPIPNRFRMPPPTRRPCTAGETLLGDGVTGCAAGRKNLTPRGPPRTATSNPHREAARPGAEAAPAAAGLAAGPAGGRRGCHPGRARRGVSRRGRRAGVAVGDVAGDRRPATGARSRAHPGRAAAAGGAAVEAKSLTATERDEDARAEWRRQMRGVDPARLVFVDECGTHTSMTRRRSRATRGIRARGAVPRNRGPVTTLLAGVSLTGMRPAMTVEGGTDTAVFATYLEHFLLPPLPALPAGTVIVVDNVGAHQPDRIGELVTAAGCQLVFLPAYSPDLSPIEEAFSKIKTLVKAAAARTHQALDAAIAAALNAVTGADAAGWFSRAGYLTRQAV